MVQAIQPDLRLLSRAVFSRETAKAMPILQTSLSLEVENDAGFISLVFHQTERPLNTQVCVLRNRVGGLVLERTFPELPGYFSLLASRILLGLKDLKPLIRIRGVEHPEAVISFYETKGKRIMNRKVAWITSSQSIGARLFFITDQNYELISLRLTEICI